MYEIPIVRMVAILHRVLLMVFVPVDLLYIGVSLFHDVNGSHLCHVSCPFSQIKLLSGSHHHLAFCDASYIYDLSGCCVCCSGCSLKTDWSSLCHVCMSVVCGRF